MSTTQEIIHRHDAYMTINQPRYPVAMVRGQGCRVWDAAGHEYIDLFAGFGGSILGHCHPELVEAVTTQAQTLWHVGNLLHTEPQTLLAEAISQHGFGGRSFFSHCGADANEAALKLARLYGNALTGKVGQRYKVITCHHSFHGRLFGTMVATAQPKVHQEFAPLLPGFTYVPFNDLDAIRQAVDEQTIAVMLEPIQGEGGVHVPDDDFLPGLRQLCDQHQLLLICDEVWTGCGRTGRYFAHQHWNIQPDIMTLAKGVGGGLPVGVMCATPALAELLDCKKRGSVAHGTTLGGNCLAMAVAHRIFQVIERDHLLAHATRLGQHVIDRFAAAARQNWAIKHVRGKGLFLGIELDLAKLPVPMKLGELVVKCMERGVLVNGTQDCVLRIAPPLNITQAELDQALDRVEAVLAGQ